jgi:hypothetical protein
MAFKPSFSIITVFAVGKFLTVPSMVYLSLLPIKLQAEKTVKKRTKVMFFVMMLS